MARNDKTKNTGPGFDLTAAGIILFALVLRLADVSGPLDNPLEMYNTRFSFELFTGGLHQPRAAKPLLYPNATAIVYYSSYLAGAGAKHFDNLSEWMEFFLANQRLFLLAGRLISAIAGFGAVWLCFAAARKLKDRNAGIVAAAIMALTVSHVALSRAAHGGAAAVFMAAAAAYAIISFAENRSPGRGAVAGSVCGLAAASAFSLSVFLLPLAAAALLPDFSGGKKKAKDASPGGALLSALAAAALAYCAASPQLILSLPHSIGGFPPKPLLTVDGVLSGAVEGVKPLPLIFGALSPAELGPAAALLAAIGACALVFAKEKKGIVALCFPAAFLAFFALYPSRTFSHLHLLYPSAAVFAGVAAASLLEKISEAKRATVLVELCIVFLLTFVTGTVVRPAPDYAPANRELVKWIDKNAPAGAVIAVEPHVPLALDYTRARVEASLEARPWKFRPDLLRGMRRSFARERNRGEIETIVLGEACFNGNPKYTKAFLQASGADFVIVSSVFRKKFTNFASKYPEMNDFHDFLDRAALEKTVIPENNSKAPMQYIIYKLPRLASRYPHELKKRFDKAADNGCLARWEIREAEEMMSRLERRR